ncbi:MAG TPA: ADP-ribosylglycohydrolase family protein, partial [Candidatus Wallbacteria bacterium]|nr:ADP-ribosylglycohydrolase family protein [Candidatus Wallbacteria bacterium]
TGSITGNMLGLINGRGAIPAEWIEKLRGREIVERMARDLHILYKGDSYKQDEEWLSKYPPF